MDLIVNGTAVARSSLGARRYYEGVMAHLAWPGAVEVSKPRAGSVAARLGEMMERGRDDAIYWSPCHRGPLFARNHVVTVLDCINIEYVYKDDWRLPVLRTVFGRLLDNAVRVVCISNATRSAVLRNFAIDPDKIVTIPGPVDVSLAPPRQAQNRSSDDFILMITNQLAHKNTRRTGEGLAASSAAARGIVVRIVGAMDPAGLAACTAAGLVVEQHRNVPDESLRNWIADCRFLLSPSLEEGLNLPIAEALSLGTDVLCSDIPVHREFYDGEVEFFDPLSQQDIVAALEAVFERPRGWHVDVRRNDRLTVADVADRYRTLFASLSQN